MQRRIFKDLVSAFPGKTYMKQQAGQYKKHLKSWCITALLFWSVLVIGSALFFLKTEWKTAMDMGRELGLYSLQKDYTFRAWNARLGGVYAKVSETTPPNPFLSHIPNREIQDQEGREFTLMNPAYMTRQVHELGLEMFGLHSHITSLNVIRPANKADSWETSALKQFEQGAKEVVELVSIDNQPFMRVMTPTFARESCLGCHPGYKVGAIRGGISVSVPMQQVIKSAKKNMLIRSVYHFFIFVIGVVGLLVFWRQTGKQLTAREGIENDLKRQEAHLRGIVENIASGIAVYERCEQDDDFIIKSINPAGLAQAQSTLEEVAGKKVTDVFPGVVEMGLFGVFQRVWQTGKPEHLPVTTYADERIFQWAENYVYKLPAGEVVAVYEDITEKKKLEQELFQAQKMEAIGTLAGGIAHDFNNILAAILGYAEMARMNLPDSSGTAKDIDEVITAGNRAADLVKQILTFSRKEQKKQQPLQISLMVKEAVKMMRSSLPATIEMETSIDQRVGMVMADPTSIHQLVVNLCTNASHAIGNDMGKMKVALHSIELGEEQLADKPVINAGSFVVLTVKDSGEGMDEKTKAQIFEPYFTTKEPGKGTGLGLAVIHGIVEQCNGFIEVESSPGQGSEFLVFLPVIDEAIDKVSTGKEITPLPSGREKILLVDDEPAITQIGQAVLTGLGYDVTAETKSGIALEKFQAAPESFDLVITDQTMPDLTGIDLAKAMLKLRPDLPIILCTGYSSAITEEEVYAIGIKFFASKPLSKRTLAGLVRQALDG